MVDSLDFSRLNVDRRGRASFSGISSRIDSAAAIRGILAAKQIPVDRIEKTIKDNQRQIGSLGELEQYINTLKNAAGKLRGKLSLDGSSDLFESKQAFANSFRPGGGTSSDAKALLGVSLTNQAQTGTQSIEILQRASAHKVAGATSVVANQNQGITGKFRLRADGEAIKGSEPIIEIAASDSLHDIRNKINAANVGVGGSGVTASIIQVDATNSILVLTADHTGKTIQFSNVTGDALGQLGITSGGNFTNELQPARTAQLRVNDLTDMDAGFQSNPFAAPTAVIGGGRITVENLADNQTITIDISAGATLAAAATAIDGTAFPSGAVVRAAVEQQADGTHRLRIHAENSGSPVRIGLDTSTAAGTGEIGANGQFVRPALLVERDSNTISDLFTGTTIDLFRAEPGTTVELRVDRNFQRTKQAIVDFVTAYNQVKTFLNQQRQVDTSTGAPVDEAVLFGNRIVGDIEAQLGLIMARGAQGVSDDFTVLSQIGIKVLSKDETTDPLQVGTVAIDDAKFDKAILADFDAVRSLFSYEFTTTDARVTLVDFNKDTAYAAHGVKMTIVGDGAGKIDAAASSVAGGGFTVSKDGKVITITRGKAKGMKLFYNGDLNNTTPVNITLRNSIGIAHQFFFGVDRLLDEETGLVPAEARVLESENKLANNRMKDQLAAIDRKRVELEDKFARMEAAMAQLASLRQQIKAAFGQLGKSDS